MAVYRVAGIKDGKIGYVNTGVITYVDIPFINRFTMNTAVENIVFEGDNTTLTTFSSADLSGALGADKFSDEVLQRVYNKTLLLTGGVSGATVTTGGTGFVSAPTVGFTGGGGTGAAATATISGGAVTAITITAQGTGYTSAPTVTFTGGAGSGAGATANLLPAAVAKRIYGGENAEFEPSPVEIVVTMAGVNESTVPATAADIRITIPRAKVSPFKPGDLGNRTKQGFELEYTSEKTSVDLLGATLPGVPSGGVTYFQDIMLVAT
jgi:hypothetical protein